MEVMTDEELHNEAEFLIEELIDSARKEDVSKLIRAYRLLHAEVSMLQQQHDRTRDAFILSLMRRLTIKTAELLGEQNHTTKIIAEAEAEYAESNPKPEVYA